MKLLVGADLHGLEEAYRRFGELLSRGEFDVGILAGDLMRYPSEGELESARSSLGAAQGTRAAAVADDGEALESTLQGLQRRFKSLLAGARKPVVYIMGNDDGIMGRGLPWESEGLFVDIHMRRATYGTYAIVGYHHSNPFVGGTFEKPFEGQESDFRSLERLVDARTILVTHCPPLGTLDSLPDGSHVGSRALRDFVARTRPLMHLFGHVHRRFGQEWVSVNAAYPLHRKFMAIDVALGKAQPIA